MEFMINPNTLRMGNLLMDQEGKYGIVTAISNGKIEWVPWPHLHEKRLYNVDRPIPITEEWILKFAEPDVSPAQGEHTKSFPISWPIFYRIVIRMNGTIRLMTPDLQFKEVAFVHQLQNIYLDLTEQELEFRGD